MLAALLITAIAFGVSFTVLSLVEQLIHKLTKNRDKSYRWGVWTFSILIAAWALLTNLGR